MDGVTMNPETGREDWLAARRALLAREKALTRLRDEVAAARRALPRVRIEADYVFDGEAGPRRLADLFEGRPQLVVQHFMFGPDWAEGCPSCSLMADQIDPLLPHLAARGIAFAAVSRAPLGKLLAFRARMGWRFPWVSSGGTGFNEAFGVAFAAEDRAAGAVPYNYTRMAFPSEEAPGVSTFERAADGGVLHAWSGYSRGLDLLMNVYNWLDIAPRGRDEAGLPWPMAWVRHHDRYAAAPAEPGCCG